MFASYVITNKKIIPNKADLILLTLLLLIGTLTYYAWNDMGVCKLLISSCYIT